MATPFPSYPALMQCVLSEVLSEYNDGQLLERFTQSGDEAAFAILLERHGPMLLGLCRRLLKDAHLAEDVVQATFLVLARKAGSIRRRDNLADWLYGVAVRLARQVRLSEAARSRQEQRAAKQDGETPAGDPGWDELLRILDEELQRLPERQRSPLLLCYLEGCTQDEAAKQLGWSLSTFRRRLEKGRELLRARMVRRGATLGAGLFAGFLAPSAIRATLPMELRHTVLTAIKAGGKGVAVSASVLVLVEGGMRMATTAKILLWSVVAVTASGLLMGVAWGTAAARRGEEPAPPAPRQVVQRAEAPVAAPIQQPRPGHDLFDDPLPNGAVARLGTVAFRHGRAWDEKSLAFSPDGKHLVSTGGGWIRRWDVATGRSLVNLGDGWRMGVVTADLLTTADGKLAFIGRGDSPGRQTFPASWECTEYDLESGKERRTYKATFPEEVGRMHNPGGRLLLADGKVLAELHYPGGPRGGPIIFWNMSAGKEGTIAHQFKAKEGRYTAMALSTDGKTLFAGDDAHTIRVFDVATEKELRSFGVANVKGVGSLAVSPDGKRLVTVAPDDGFLRLWNLEKGTEERILDYPEDGKVRSLLFSPDGRTVILATTGKTTGSLAAVRTWDAASGLPGKAWTDDPTFGLTVTVNPDGKTLAAMNDHGVIRLWDLATGKEKHPLEASTCPLKAVSFGPDSKTLLTVGEDHSFREWDATGRLLDAPRRQLLPGYSLKFYARFAAGGRLLSLSVYDNGKKVRLLDAATGKVLSEQRGFGPIFSADGKRMATIDLDFEGSPIRVFDVGTGNEIQTLKQPKEGEVPNWTPELRGFTPNGQSIILQGEVVSMWDVQSGKRRTSWSLLRNKLLKESLEKTVPRRDVPRQTAPGRDVPKQVEKQISPERIKAVAVSLDGSKMAFGVSDRFTFTRLMLFETATGKLLHQFDLDDVQQLEQLAFSPDGKLLAVGGYLQVFLWDVETGKVLHTFKGHRGAVNSLAFSPDSKRLASASEDSTVLIWDLSK